LWLEVRPAEFHHWFDEAGLTVESGICFLNLVLSSQNNPSWLFHQDGVNTSRIILEQLPANCKGYLSQLVDKDDVNVSSKVLKVVIPTTDGTWIRQNLIRQRLRNCRQVHEIIEFPKPGQYITKQPFNEIPKMGLLQLLESAVAILMVDLGPSPLEYDRRTEAELLNRLSLPLVLPRSSSRKTLALLEGRPSWQVGEWVYRAARELNIELVVLDRTGHWMSEGPHTHLRERFIALDMSLDDKLPQRIVDSLRKIHVDGIVSYSDLYLIAAAKAADILGLPTSSHLLHETCRDKYLTRRLQSPNNFQSMLVQGSEGVADLVNHPTASQTLRYPLVIKPCSGWGSEGVAKVNNPEQLLEAARRIDTVRFGGDSLTIETYADGPEVDANIILCDGELVFSEIADQFPTDADSSATDATANFLELDLFLPSALPNEEQSLMIRELVNIICSMGFRNGVFHIEARMQGSAMSYRSVAGLLDLVPNEVATVGDRDVVLMEINCRPGNMLCTYAAAYTYGVDYYAMHQLLAIGDSLRARALAHSYLGGAQYHCDVALIPVRQGGIFMSEDAIAKFALENPWLMAQVVKSECLFRQGACVPDPHQSALTWIAYFMVASHSREVVLTTVQHIRQSFKYQMSSTPGGNVKDYTFYGHAASSRHSSHPF
jgi:biotin carboxylase